MNTHEYEVCVDWTGNMGSGTRTYNGYARDHVIMAAGKPEIMGSSDPAFRGDTARYSPEDLLVASLSACHMLWYLHLCSANRINVVAYRDRAFGQMASAGNGAGRFVRVLLRPAVQIDEESDPTRARALHKEAHCLCFVANSVNFPVEIEGQDIVQMSAS
jgi:organic hydroperoxide reductase OsmC/OhrA